ncbi:MAG TPA: Wzz/FepE/Etk N-terminal domain-containing protein [Acholeplasmataceae bacterium]|nr:Wzz/FepE/Etk N-terminal domain-containing protein [Acholeplasmataceae bacterium]
MKGIKSMEDMQQTQEIDLLSLFRMLLNKWYVILISTLLCFGLASIYAYVMLDDKYTAQTSMIILVENDVQSDEQNFNFSQKLTKTYTELAKSDLVIEQVISSLSLNQTSDELRKMMTISGVQDTPVIKLSIVAKDNILAKDIANKTVQVMQQVSLQFEGFDNIEVLDVAQTPDIPSGPNRILYVAIGIILGGILGVGIIFIVELVDRSIKTPDDIERKLGLRTLAIIPDYQMESEIEEL